MNAETSDSEASKVTVGNAFSEIADAFKRNVESVYQLAEFDRLVLAYAIRSLETVEASAKNADVTNYLLTVTKSLQHLRDIRTNDSMRGDYQHIFNQCVVLLVSYFGSAIDDLFSACVAMRLTSNPPPELQTAELKIPVSEFVELGGDLRERVGDLLIRKGDISFQDMKSTARAFEKYCGHNPERDKDCNNIILGQACRHVIVHSGAIVDRRCIGQVKSATPRALKPDLADGKVEFNVDELKVLGSSMMAYVMKLIIALNASEPKV